MAISFGPRAASVPAFTRQFATMGPAAALARIDAGEAADPGPDGNAVPALFAAFDRMAGAAAPEAPAAGPVPDGDETATAWRQPSSLPSDAERMAAFNKAAKSEYYLDKVNLIDEASDRFHEESQNDLDNFLARMANFETALVAHLAEPWKPTAREYIDRKRQQFSAIIGAKTWAQAESRTNARLGSFADDSLARAGTAAHDGDLGALAENRHKFDVALDGRTDLDDDEKQKTRRDFEGGVATQALLGDLDRAHQAGGLEDATRLVDDLMAGRAGGGKLADDQHQPIVRTVSARLEDLRAADRLAKARAETQRRQAVTQRLDAVTRQIDEGTFGRKELEILRQTGEFGGDLKAYDTLARAIDERHAAELARHAGLQRVEDGLAGGRTLDPAKPDDVAAVEAWWKARRDAEPKGALADAAAIAKRTRILPAAAGEGILDALTYGTPEKQAEAAKALDALNQDAPAVAEALPLAARTRADVIGRALAQGRDPAAAAAIAEQLLGPATGLAKDAARVAPMGPVTLLAGTDNGGKPDGGEDGTIIAGGAGEDTLMDGAGGDTPAGEEDEADDVDDSDDGEGNWGAGAYSGDADSGPKDPEDGKWLLDWIPVLGELRSAKEAHEEFAAAREASEAGDEAAADEHRTNAYLAILGTIPGLGKLAKLRKAGKAAKAGERSAAKAAKTGRTVEGTVSGGRIEHFAADTADFDAFAKRARERTVPAFRNREEAATFESGLQKQFQANGIDDGKVVVRGSAATGRKFNGETGKYDGKPFDAGHPSDLDVAVVSPKLLAKAKELARNWNEELNGKCPFKLRGDGTRTGPLSNKDLKELGLENLLPKEIGGKRRKSSLVIYGDMESLEQRGPYVPLD